MKYLWLLDNGHGGIINGEYQTSGKRSPLWDNGTQLFEGEFNRDIVRRIAKRLTELSIRFEILVPEKQDVSLSSRVVRVNAYKGLKEVYPILVSVHGNAGGGTGFEIWTSKGQTKSDKIATVFHSNATKEFPEKIMRSDFSDGDPDKESQFYILKKTFCPAILTENFFMDTYVDCQFMLSEEGRRRIAQFHVDAIWEIERNDLI